MSDFGPPDQSKEPVCVVTKITFASWRSIPGAVLRFRRLRRIGRKLVPGLVDAHLQLRGKATLMFISLWRDEVALMQFTTLEAHVDAVRWSIRKRGQVWSGVFRLAGTSSMSVPWLGTIRHWKPLAAPEVERVAADES